MTTRIVLLFIGFFILTGAAGEIRSAPVRAAIEGVIGHAT